MTASDLIKRVLFGRPKRPADTALIIKPPRPGPDSMATRGYVDNGFTVAPHSRRGPLGWRIAGGVAIGFIVLSGLITLVVRPIVALTAGPDPEPPAVARMDTDAAERLAVAYTADYWSFDPADPEGRQVALTRWTGTAASAVPSVEGSSELRTDLVTTGTVITKGAGLAIVQTTARVTVATLPEGSTVNTEGVTPTDPETAADGPPVAADPGPAAAPYTPQASLWLTLDVVIVDDAGALAVRGAALTGDAPTILELPSAEVDAQTTAATSTAELPAELFAAVAEGDLQYLTTPDVQLAGLSGAVELAGVTRWSVATGSADDGTRYASAEVTWELPGLTFAQPYALSMTEEDGRWLLSAVGPRIEE